MTRMLTQTGTNQYDPVGLGQCIRTYIEGVGESILTTLVKRNRVDAVITDCNTANTNWRNQTY